MIGLPQKTNWDSHPTCSRAGPRGRRHVGRLSCHSDGREHGLQCVGEQLPGSCRCRFACSLRCQCCQDLDLEALLGGRCHKAVHGEVVDDGGGLGALDAVREAGAHRGRPRGAQCEAGPGQGVEVRVWARGVLSVAGRCSVGKELGGGRVQPLG